MSSIPSLSTTPAALPAVNVHPHGHRHGIHVQSTDDSSSDTAAQLPVGSTQNLFGGLLQTLEQVIGVQSVAASPAAASSTAAAAGSSASTPATPAGAVTNAPSAQSTSALLRNYLSNLQELNVNSAPAGQFAGSNLRVNA